MGTAATVFVVARNASLREAGQLLLYVRRESRAVSRRVLRFKIEGWCRNLLRG